jgi:hypothetical protein
MKTTATPADLPDENSPRSRYLNRLIRAGGETLYASRAGNPEDWDYSAVDAAAAWAATIGHPIEHLFPTANALVVIGGGRATAFIGDPAAGGCVRDLTNVILVDAMTVVKQ